MGGTYQKPAHRSHFPERLPFFEQCPFFLPSCHPSFFYMAVILMSVSPTKTSGAGRQGSWAVSSICHRPSTHISAQQAQLPPSHQGLDAPSPLTMRLALAMWCLITPPPRMIIPECLAKMAWVLMSLRSGEESCGQALDPASSPTPLLCGPSASPSTMSSTRPGFL